MKAQNSERELDCNMLVKLKLICWVLCWTQCCALCWAQPDFSFQKKSDRLLISLENKTVAEFVFVDPKILRPYFSNLCLIDGLQVTRNHPPVEATDATDHEAMHPGVWLGFGDINGHDFWRNKARIRHIRFITEPDCQNSNLSFATECEMQTSDGQTLCRLANQFRLMSRPASWLLVWEATFQTDAQTVVFGDQEEMGFGARVATSITEKNGGQIVNSNGLQSARHTWGKAAGWCDYSGKIAGKSVGITLMASPNNFRESWWHNRDYGVFVANPFGRQSMQQGSTSEVKIEQGQSLTLRFGAFLHGELESEAEVISQTFDEFASAPPN